MEKSVGRQGFCPEVEPNRSHESETLTLLNDGTLSFILLDPDRAAGSLVRSRGPVDVRCVMEQSGCELDLFTEEAPPSDRLRCEFEVGGRPRIRRIDRTSKGAVCLDRWSINAMDCDATGRTARRIIHWIIWSCYSSRSRSAHRLRIRRAAATASASASAAGQMLSIDPMIESIKRTFTRHYLSNTQASTARRSGPGLLVGCAC